MKYYYWFYLKINVSEFQLILHDHITCSSSYELQLKRIRLWLAICLCFHWKDAEFTGKYILELFPLLHESTPTVIRGMMWVMICSLQGVIECTLTPHIFLGCNKSIRGVEKVSLQFYQNIAQLRFLKAYFQEYIFYTKNVVFFWPHENQSMALSYFVPRSGQWIRPLLYCWFVGSYQKLCG